MEKVWLVMHGDYNGTGVVSVHLSEEAALAGIQKAHKGYRPMMGGDEHSFIPLKFGENGWDCGYVYRNVRECGFSIVSHEINDGGLAER